MRRRRGFPDTYPLDAPALARRLQDDGCWRGARLLRSIGTDSRGWQKRLLADLPLRWPSRALARASQGDPRLYARYGTSRVFLGWENTALALSDLYRSAELWRLSPLPRAELTPPCGSPSGLVLPGDLYRLARTHVVVRIAGAGVPLAPTRIEGATVLVDVHDSFNPLPQRRWWFPLVAPRTVYAETVLEQSSLALKKAYEDGPMGAWYVQINSLRQALRMGED